MSQNQRNLVDLNKLIMVCEVVLLFYIILAKVPCVAHGILKTLEKIRILKTKSNFIAHVPTRVPTPHGFP